MAMYSAHIAFMLEILALAAGLVALHYATAMHSGKIRLAGLILVIGSAVSLSCNLYYSGKYIFMGHFEHPYEFNVMLEGNGPHYHCSGSVGD
jgi:hypothetical protein